MKALLVLLAVIAIANAASVAIAHLKGTPADPNIDGTVYFVQFNDTYHWVYADISGITVNPGAIHGLHVHAYGDITDALANSAGGHYVGGGNGTHACEDVTPRHEGDMGNWNATNGSILQQKTLDLLMSNGAHSIIGKAVVLHGSPDDCIGQPAGNAGARIAVGVIGVANPAYVPQVVIDAAGGAFTTNDAVSADTEIFKAVAVLTPTTASSDLTNVRGTVTFEQDATTGFITITGVFTGLPSGKGYGLHIHTFADYYTGGAVNGTAAGGHFMNPTDQHGSPYVSTRHIGDLGNICTFDSDGNAYYQWVMNDTKFTLNNDNNILGRNLIVHDAYDTMLPTSAFGNRVAQGVIGVTNNTAEGIVTIPSSVTPSDPLCLSFAPTAPPTSGSTASPSSTTSATTSAPSTTSSSSFLAVCYTTMLLVLAVVLF